MEQQKMVKLSVEVRRGADRFRVGVQARSIRKAMSVVGARYPQAGIRVEFPIEPEGFFVTEPSAPAVICGYEQIQGVAA